MSTNNDQQVAEILARGVARVKARGIAQRDASADETADDPQRRNDAACDSTQPIAPEATR